jgi:5'-3' exonuclease
MSLDILSDKILAIDASIWIYQFAHAMKDAGTGEQVKASHIIGFFKRICKLLFLRIKPVFVFDGPPIPLKFACLRKRHDETISDAMFRKAAQQILLQNLQTLGKPVRTSPPPFMPGPSSDVDEIHVLTDSDDGSSDGLSPTRRLRLTVPEEFRGFMSSRRTLDCVALPVTPEKQRDLSHESADKYREWDIGGIDIPIDEATLKDLPLHEQYRGLLQARSAMLTHGRRKALQMASSSSSSSTRFTDLHSLSTEQIKAVVDLARVTDMAKSVRLQMSREDHKNEYIAPDDLHAPTENPFPVKKRKKSSLKQWYLEGDVSEKHSVLATARTIKREDLLFKSDDSPKSEPKSPSSYSESSEGDLTEKLFGAEWGFEGTKGGLQEPVPADYSPKPVEKPIRTFPPEPPEPTQPTPPQPVIEEPIREVHPEPVNAIQPESDEESLVSSQEIEIASESEEEPVDDSLGGEQVSKSFVAPEEARSLPEPIASSSPETTSALPPVDPAFAEFNPDDIRIFLSELETDLGDDFHVPPPASNGPEQDAYTEIQQLLTAFGIPWVDAPADAEAQCAFLCSAGLVDGVISDDSDTLIYGSPVVFRHLYLGDSTVEFFQKSAIGFNDEQLISLALLLGCDFTEGVRGIGPVNGAEIVRHYAGIEGLGRFRAWCDDPVDKFGIGEYDSPELVLFKQTHANYRTLWVFPEDFPSQEVWDVFDLPHVDRSDEAFSWADPLPEEVVRVVTSYTSITPMQVETILGATLAKYKETKLQRRITDYFSPAFQRGNVAEVVSKRLKAALA